MIIESFPQPFEICEIDPGEFTVQINADVVDSVVAFDM